MRWWSWTVRKQVEPGGDGSRFRPAGHVTPASRDGRTVLLDLGTEHFFGLDEVGSAIWLHLEARRAVPDIAAHLAGEYAAPVDRLEADVRGFLAHLSERGLVVPAAPGA